VSSQLQIASSGAGRRAPSGRSARARSVQGALLDAVPVEQRRQHRRLWPYFVLAALSFAVADVLFSAVMFLGIAIGMIGAFVGAFARAEARRVRGTRVFVAGLAILVGPATLWIVSAF
jgi:hypothetical protein